MLTTLVTIMLSQLLESALLRITITKFKQGQQQQGVGQTKISELWESPADLKNPESVVYAPKQDVLFVSNIDGKPDQKDQNGFISKVSPTNGSIIELDWIKGLNTPKGMAI